MINVIGYIVRTIQERLDAALDEIRIPFVFGVEPPVAIWVDA